jgi:hypothetical protein
LGNVAGRYNVPLRTLNTYLKQLRKLVLGKNDDGFLCRATRNDGCDTTNDDRAELHNMVDVVTTSYGRRGFAANAARASAAKPGRKEKNQAKRARVKVLKAARLQQVPTYQLDDTLTRDVLVKALMHGSGAVKVAIDPSALNKHLEEQGANIDAAFTRKKKFDPIDSDAHRLTRLVVAAEKGLFPDAVQQIADLLLLQVHGRALIESQADGPVQETHIDRFDITREQYLQVVRGERMSPVSLLWSPAGGHVHVFPGTQYLIGEANARTSKDKAQRLRALANGEGAVRVDFAPHEIMLFNSMLWHHGGSYPTTHRRFFAYLMGGKTCIKLTNQVAEGNKRTKVAGILKLKDVIGDFLK